MSSHQQTPAWPFLAILICLFALSVTAPRAWERIASKQPLADVLDAHCVRPVATYPSPQQLEAVHARLAPWMPELLGRASTLTDVRRAATADLGRAIAKTLVALAAPSDLPVPFHHAPAYASQAQEPPPAAPAAAPAEVFDRRVERLPRVDASSWPRPEALVEQLAALREKSGVGDWASRVIGEIEALCAVSTEQPATARSRIDTIAKLSAESEKVAAKARERDVAARINRVRYAIERRLPLWRAIASSQAPASLGAQPTAKQYERIAEQIGRIRELAAQSAQGPQWVNYLLLDQLTAAGEQDIDARKQLAAEFERRLNSPKFDDAQRRFVAAGPPAQLARELRLWTAEPVGLVDLLAHIETFERSQLTSDARRIAQDLDRLRSIDHPATRSLLTSLENDYRNANLRLVFSGELVNRFMPQPSTVESPVNDVIVGAQVRGQSTTFTKLFVRLVPDENNVRLGLEATGTVNSNTTSTSGPATFYSGGESSFIVRKLFVYDKRGLRLWPSQAEADNYYNGLYGLQTDFDGIPLFGSLARNIARSQQQESLGQARAEVESKVAFRAMQQLDSQVEPRLVAAVTKMRDGAWATLKELSLQPEPVGMSTTADRLAMRLRVATADQLAGYTPRPRAPSDSQFSVQLHQSALNNAAEQLELNGRTFTLPELFDWLGKRLHSKSDALHEELPEDVSITFAENDAVRVRCADGRVEVMLSVKQLTQGRSRWHDFTVRAQYTPTKDGERPQLVRDGTIYLEGDSLKGKTHIMLRTIFSKTLSRSRPWNLLNEKLINDPRMAHLELRQFDIEEGWIGLAYCNKPAQAEVARRAK